MAELLRGGRETPSGHCEFHVDDGGGWTAPEGGEPAFDDVTAFDWRASRHPAPGGSGSRFGPGGDDVELWGKTEAQAHRWLRTQTGWSGYAIVRVPGSDRSRRARVLR